MDLVHPRPLSQPPWGARDGAWTNLSACWVPASLPLPPHPPPTALSLSFPTCPTCITSTPTTVAHVPTPTRTSHPACSGPASHPQLLKEPLVPKPAGSSC